MENKAEILGQELVATSNVQFGFFSRSGGVSDGEKYNAGPNYAYASGLNCGLATKDDHQKVIQNLRIAVGEITANWAEQRGQLFIATTQYRGVVQVIDETNIDQLKIEGRKNAADMLKRELAPEEDFLAVLKADALVINFSKDPKLADIIISGVGADAHQIVLFDDKAQVAAVIASSHKSIAYGVMEKVVEEMIRQGASRENIETIIGPGLARESNEFGVETSRNFTETGKIGKEKVGSNPDVFVEQPFVTDPRYVEFFVRKEDDGYKPIGLEETTGKCLFDMPGLIKFKAAQMGLGKVHDTAIDTMRDHRVYGARRDAGPATEHLKTGRNLFFAARKSIKPKDLLAESESPSEKTR